MTSQARGAAGDLPFSVRRGEAGVGVAARREGHSHAEVTLLGGFRLMVGGREVALPIGAQRLVAVLALRGRLSRRRLAGTLRPDTPEPRAMASLRTGIWRVNQAAPALVATIGGQVDLDHRTVVDIRLVIEHSIEILRGAATETSTLSTLMQDGELLPDWEDGWLGEDRERLRQMRLHVLERVVEQLTDVGHFGLAIETALSVLRADVLRESAHRALVRVHLAEGNLNEARRTYQACEQLFRQELGVPLTASMTNLLGSSLPTQGLHDPAICDGGRPAMPRS